MNIPRDVILDLLPLYMAGEVTPATRTFVEQVLAQDPALAEEVRALWAKDLAMGAAPAPPPELELRSLRRTRRLLGLQKWLFGLAITFSAISMSFQFKTENGHVVDAHFLLRDQPGLLGGSVAVAVVLWIAYIVLRRKLRATAL